MWEGIEDRLALLELLTEGQLKCRRSQDAAYGWLEELPWTRATGRRNELALVPERRPELVQLLNRVWPDWRDQHLALLECGEPPTPAGWRRLGDVRRSRALPDLPARLNRRTAAAATARGAKSTLTPSRVDALGEVEVVDDGIVRIRPPRGLRVRRGETQLVLDDVVAVLDEVGVVDRALRDGLEIEGTIRAVLLVENLGAWRDMPQPEGWMLVHVPGWNTLTVRSLLALLVGIPVVHFGDLDPNGVRIYRHLRSTVPTLGWFVPEFWRELVSDHAQRADWPDDLDLSDCPELVASLARQGLWMEQERLALDQRLYAALERLACRLEER